MLLLVTTLSRQKFYHVANGSGNRNTRADLFNCQKNYSLERNFINCGPQASATESLVHSLQRYQSRILTS